MNTTTSIPDGLTHVEFEFCRDYTIEGYADATGFRDITDTETPAGWHKYSVRQDDNGDPHDIVNPHDIWNDKAFDFITGEDLTDRINRDGGAIEIRLLGLHRLTGKTAVARHQGPGHGNHTTHRKTTTGKHTQTADTAIIQPQETSVDTTKETDTIRRTILTIADKIGFRVKPRGGKFDIHMPITLISWFNVDPDYETFAIHVRDGESWTVRDFIGPDAPATPETPEEVVDVLSAHSPDDLDIVFADDADDTKARAYRILLALRYEFDYAIIPVAA